MSRRGRSGVARLGVSQDRRGGGVRTWTGPGARACGCRHRGRATKDALLGDVLAVRTVQPVAAELRAACRLPTAVPAPPCHRRPPGSSPLAPLLPKPLNQFLSLSLTYDREFTRQVSVLPLGDGG